MPHQVTAMGAALMADATRTRIAPWGYVVVADSASIRTTIRTTAAVAAWFAPTRHHSARASVRYRLAAWTRERVARRCAAGPTAADRGSSAAFQEPGNPTLNVMPSKADKPRVLWAVLYASEIASSEMILRFLPRRDTATPFKVSPQMLVARKCSPKCSPPRGTA